MIIYQHVVKNMQFSHIFKKNHLKSLTLLEVQNQNRFNIEEKFLSFIQRHLTEDKIAQFVEALSEFPEFAPYLEKWVDSE